MLVKHFKQAVVVVGIFVALSIYVLHTRSHAGNGLGLAAWARRHQSIFYQHVLDGTPSNALAGGPIGAAASAGAADLDDNASLPVYIDDDEDAAFFAQKESPVGKKLDKQKDGKAGGKSDTKASVNTGPEEDEGQDADEDEDEDDDEPTTSSDHRELFSLTSINRKFFPIFFGVTMRIYNPNIIPHPMRHDLWIVIAQREQSGEENVLGAEQVTCSAGFLNDVLTCTDEPTILAVAPSIGGVCEGDLAYLNFRPGPRDARAFVTPTGPQILYGSQSQYSCLGIWIQDLRTLSPEFAIESALPQIFRGATEIRRPTPGGPIQKNFFLFYDTFNKAYVHHDIWPKRVFAELAFDGSVGENLAPAAANSDAVCMAQYMPIANPPWQSIHQATNSLAITLCQRADPGCSPNENNTFIMTIFQHKVYRDYHSEYEPFVMLFQQSAPFAIHAISQRPLWIHGRGPLTKDSHSVQFEVHEKGRPIPPGHTEMFYITSMSWKTHGQKYHGYVDDPLFLSFGIEDSRGAVMDVLAGDLVQDLGLCATMASARV